MPKWKKKNKIYEEKKNEKLCGRLNSHECNGLIRCIRAMSNRQVQEERQRQQNNNGMV